MRKPFQELLLDLEQAEGDEEKSPAILAELATRIDEIKEHTDDLTAQGAGLRAEAALIAKNRIDPLLSAAKARENKAARIMARIGGFMEQRKFEALPGILWRLDLRENNPKVVPGQEPDAAIYLKFPAFIKRDVIYSWKKKEMAIAMKAGVEIPYARLVQDKHVEFEVRR